MSDGLNTPKIPRHGTPPVRLKTDRIGLCVMAHVSNMLITVFVLAHPVQPFALNRVAL